MPTEHSFSRMSTIPRYRSSRETVRDAKIAPTCFFYNRCDCWFAIAAFAILTTGRAIAPLNRLPRHVCSFIAQLMTRNCSSEYSSPGEEALCFMRMCRATTLLVGSFTSGRRSEMVTQLRNLLLPCCRFSCMHKSQQPSRYSSMNCGVLSPWNNHIHLGDLETTKDCCVHLPSIPRGVWTQHGRRVAVRQIAAVSWWFSRK